MITLYGIKTCDTVKKAMAWLDARSIAYTFHDYKTAGVDRQLLQDWCGIFGWERVLNREGTTFRGLSDRDKQDLDQGKAVRLMLAAPSLIKRPILMQDKRPQAVGFKPDVYADLFGA